MLSRKPSVYFKKQKTVIKRGKQKQHNNESYSTGGADKEICLKKEFGARMFTLCFVGK
jgi:hypothetical protein